VIAALAGPDPARSISDARPLPMLVSKLGEDAEKRHAGSTVV
jgi:hypothetical protein